MSIDCSYIRARHRSGRTSLHSDVDVCRQQKMEMWFGAISLKLFDASYFRSQNSENPGFLGSHVDAEFGRMRGKLRSFANVVKWYFSLMNIKSG